jgi:hypothetical protein
MKKMSQCCGIKQYIQTEKLQKIVAIPADRNVVQKKSGKEVKIQQFMYRDITNVEPEMYDYTSYNWSHCNYNEKLKEKSGSYTRKTTHRFTTADSYTWNITRKTESAAV